MPWRSPPNGSGTGTTAWWVYLCTFELKKWMLIAMENLFLWYKTLFGLRETEGFYCLQPGTKIRVVAKREPNSHVFRPCCEPQSMCKHLCHPNVILDLWTIWYDMHIRLASVPPHLFECEWIYLGQLRRSIDYTTWIPSYHSWARAVRAIPNGPSFTQEYLSAHAIKIR